MVGGCRGYVVGGCRGYVVGGCRGYVVGGVRGYVVAGCRGYGIKANSAQLKLELGLSLAIRKSHFIIKAYLHPGNPE